MKFTERETEVMAGIAQYLINRPYGEVFTHIEGLKEIGVIQFTKTPVEEPVAEESENEKMD